MASLRQRLSEPRVVIAPGVFDLVSLHLAEQTGFGVAASHVGVPGADVLFVESPESEDDMARIGKAFHLPLVANMVPGGRTPVLSPAQLQGGKAQPLMPFADFNTAVGFQDIWDFEKRHD